MMWLTSEDVEGLLGCPVAALPYPVTRLVRERLGDRAVVAGDAEGLNLEGFLRKEGGLLESVVCEGVSRGVREVGVPEALQEVPVPDRVVSYRGSEKPLGWDTEQGLYSVVWRGEEFLLLKLSWPTEYCVASRLWIAGPAREAVLDLYREVCRWSWEVRDEVLVFSGGCWSKNAQLFTDIQSSRFEDLVLAPGFKEGIWEDCRSFFDSQALYAELEVPWKRGALFLGPPGNGKSHMLKSLVNRLGVPCLYVQSLLSQFGTEHGNIQQVFERARQSAPCILVFEDLDSHVHDGNRSFFLNELDGFAENLGILTVATTNHPERLDPAILERPSRFDRKYTFELPAARERRRYLELWNRRLAGPLRLTLEACEEVATRTEGFSFAYLKELVLSARMVYMHRRRPLQEIIAEQVVSLRAQMARHPEERRAVLGEED